MYMGGGLDVILEWEVTYFYAVSRFNFFIKNGAIALFLILPVYCMCIIFVIFLKDPYMSSISYPISISFSTREGCHAFIMISSLYVAHRVAQRSLLS